MSTSPKTTTHRDELYSYFRELKQVGEINSVHADLGQDLADLLNANRPSGDQLDPKYFRTFDQSAQKAKLSICADVRDALPLVEKLRLSQTDNREIYERQFPGKSWDVHDSDRTLFRYRKKNTPPLGNDCPLLGDYVHYRAEVRLANTKHGIGKQTLSISRMFYRFYVHANMHMRIMGLPVIYRGSYLGMRGWVVDNEKEFLGIGHIVDRSGPDKDDETIFGGISTLSVRYKLPSSYTLRRNDKNGVQRIFCAPTLHYRAIHGHAPSASRGFLLRVEGLEDFGGKAENSPGDRYGMIRELQERLTTKFHKELSWAEAAETLEKHTGFHRDVFCSTDAGRLHGLLINQPPEETRGDGATGNGPLTFDLQGKSTRKTGKPTRPQVITP